MKKTNKLLVAFASLGMVIAGGAAIGMMTKAGLKTSAAQVEAKSWDFTAKTTSHSTYTDSWTYGTDCLITGGANNNGGWAYVRTGGKGATGGVALTSTYATSAAVSDDISSINLTARNVTSGSGFTLNSITLLVASDSTFATAIDTISNVTVSTAMTWTPTTGTSWGTGRYFKFTFSATSTSTDNRGMDVQKVVFNKTGTVVNATSVSVALGASTLTSIGATTTATATVLPAEATDKSVTWSSSDENVAIVNANGVVSAVSNGTANIIATCTAVPTVTNYQTITISGIAASDAYDKTLNATRFGFGTSYPNEIVVSGLDNVSYKTNDVIKSSSGVIQFKATTSYLYNVTALANPIKNITLVAGPNTKNRTYDTTLALYCGTANNPSTAVTGVTDSTTHITTYDVATAGSNYTYFKFAPSSTYANYVASIVLELTAADTSAVGMARTQAQTWLDGTATACTNLAVDSQDWDLICNDYTNLGAGVKAAFTNEVTNATYSTSVTAIQKWVARYTYIVNKYTSYADPMGLRSSSAIDIKATLAGSDTASNIIVLVSLTIVLAGGAYLYIRRRKHA
jgi:uncharacterized protein YjdB